MAMTPKSNLFGPREVFLQKEDGSFVPLGEADISIGELQLSEGDPPKWFTSDSCAPVEFTCEVSTDRVSFQRLIDETYLGSVVNFISNARKYGMRKGYYFTLREKEYLLLRGAARRQHGMNPTRYIRSVIPSAPAKLFRVRLPSGSWVWRK